MNLLAERRQRLDGALAHGLSRMPKEDRARLVSLLSELNKVLQPSAQPPRDPAQGRTGGRTSRRVNAPFGMSVRTRTDRRLRRENDATMSSRIHPAAVAARGTVDGSAPDDRRQALSAMMFAGRAVTELILLGSLFALYRYGRLLATGHEATARADAQWVHQAERLVHLPSEAGVQAAVQAAAGSTKLFEAANTYYVAVHFPLAIAFLTWGFLVRERHEYPWARNLLIMQTGLAGLGDPHRLPTRTTTHVSQLGVQRHRRDLRTLRLRRVGSPCRQPVRRHAQPAHRMGGPHRRRCRPHRSTLARCVGDRTRPSHYGGCDRDRQPLVDRRLGQRRSADHGPSSFPLTGLLPHRLRSLEAPAQHHSSRPFSETGRPYATAYNAAK